VDDEMRAGSGRGRLSAVDAVPALDRLGGVADNGSLLRLATRARVRGALRRGEIVRVARGRYALPTARDALVAAARLSAVLSRRSAAAYWGWEQKTQPPVPELTVPRNRNVPAERREGVDLVWAALQPDEIVDDIATSRDRTLVDCMRLLPFDEALAIADSALRRGDVTHAQLVWLAAQVHGKGADQARRVAAAASGKAANPFESALRAISLRVPGLALQPQVWLTFGGANVYPDLMDRRLGLVVEAESFEWHGEAKALTRDCVRYNAFALAGFVVLRFSWVQVMFEPAYVEKCLRTAVEHRRQPGRQPGRQPRRRANAPQMGRKSA
jgi:hypothetical protein